MTTPPNTEGPTQSLGEDSEAVEIRAVERADLLSVFRIEKAVFPQPWPFAAFERLLDAPAFLVGERTTPTTDGPGTVVGYIVGDVMPNGGRDIGHVKDLAVRPSEQGQGIGRRLLQAGLARMRAAGAHVVKLEVRESNDAARSLYESVGFEVARRSPRYYDDGEAALVMLIDVVEWSMKQESAVQ